MLKNIPDHIGQWQRRPKLVQASSGVQPGVQPCTPLK